MIDRLLRFFVAQPHRLTLAGRLLYRLAGLQVVAGVIAQVALSTLRRSHGGGYHRIGDVWPHWPTWWIPETVVGMLAVTTVATIGLALAYRGRQRDRGWA